MAFLERHHLIGALDDWDEIDSTFRQWERWFAEIEESHLTYPVLVFFRSPQSDRSWVAAAGTMLDTAALAASCLPRGKVGSAGLCIRAGFLALRRIADFFGIEFDHDPAPDDPISITRADFDEAWDRLAAAGIESQTGPGPGLARLRRPARQLRHRLVGARRHHGCGIRSVDVRQIGTVS